MFRSLRDIVTGNRRADDSDNRPIESFAGGERSGLAIQQPNERSHSTTVLKLYRNGFILEDGPFRPISDPVNKRFVETIEKGDAPEELRQRATTGEVLDLSLLDCRDRDYEPPHTPATPNYVLFGGQGQSLAAGSASVSQTSRDLSRGEVFVDPALPQTTLMVRFPNGSRTTQIFNTSATVGDLRRYVAQVTNSETATILNGFPPKQIPQSEDSKSLEDAGILNDTIIVK